MALDERYMPRGTPYDDSADPADGVDPLGTLPLAERLAEIVLPGLTARMWRPRLLTYAALTAWIAESIENRFNIPRQDVFLEARLAFERIFVSACARQMEEDGNLPPEAFARLPGSRLASRAYERRHPLGRGNFLKGQATNGPFGVMANLARELDILEQDGDRLKPAGGDLLSKWAKENGLTDFSWHLEYNQPVKNPDFLRSWITATAEHLIKGVWRTPQWTGWMEIAARFRLDGAGREEKRFLRNRLEGDPVRKRFLRLLEQPDVRKSYISAKPRGPREQERCAVSQILKQPAESREDEIIRASCAIIAAFENAASLLEAAFYSLCWGSKAAGTHGLTGSQNKELDKQLNELKGILPAAGRRLRLALENNLSPLEKRLNDDVAADLTKVASLAERSYELPNELIDATLQRHEEVQRRRNRGMWIQRKGSKLFLMPGYGYPGEDLPAIGTRFIHTFRIPNAYSFLHDLDGKGVKPAAGKESGNGENG